MQAEAIDGCRGMKKSESPDTPPVNLRRYVAKQLGKRSVEVSDKWLAYLMDMIDEPTRDIFPTETYLDHIPLLIEEIATVLGRSDEELTLANSLIESKATELGQLRHEQKATVNQLLREYDILSKILEELIIEESKNYCGEWESRDGILLMASVSRIVRSILQSTVDSFVENYMQTIEEQTEKLVAFNTFVSHELKTPLQAASLNLELLLEGKDTSDEDVLDLIRVQGSTQQAISMLSNIENLIKDSDAPQLDSPIKQYVDLAALIRDVEMQIQEALGSRDVEMIIQPDMGKLFAETAKLKLIFTNLLTNAVKYSDPAKDSRRVEVRSAQPDDADMLEITIEDNGLGIDSEMMDEVLKMRVRAHENLDDENDVSGHGLGLYLVSEAISDLGGELELESEPGQGTVIRLLLPENKRSADYSAMPRL